MGAADPAVVTPARTFSVIVLAHLLSLRTHLVRTRLCSGSLRARGTKPGRSGGESIPLGRMVVVSRAGDAPGTVGMAATATSNTYPVVRPCFAWASQPAGWVAHAHVHECVGLVIIMKG